MQQFKVMLCITVNSMETVSPTEVKEYMEDFMASTEDFDIGTVDDVEVEEV